MSGLDALSEAAAARNEPLPVAESASQAAGSKRPRAARRTKLQMAQDKVKELQASLEKLEEEKNKQKAASAAAANDSAAQINAVQYFLYSLLRSRNRCISIGDYCPWQREVPG